MIRFHWHESNKGNVLHLLAGECGIELARIEKAKAWWHLTMWIPGTKGRWAYNEKSIQMDEAERLVREFLSTCCDITPH